TSRVRSSESWTTSIPPTRVSSSRTRRVMARKRRRGRSRPSRRHWVSPLEKQGILALMRLAAGAKLQGVANLKGVAYSKPNSPAIGGGPPGLIDSSGLGIAAFVAPAKLDPKQV